MIDARWVGWIVGVAVVGYVAAYNLDLLPKNKRTTQPTASERERPRSPTLTSEVVLSPHETLKVLSIPDPLLNDPLLDNRCLIYVNRELRIATSTCIP